MFSLFAVGGPFLGARAGLRAVLSGDDMGVGDFIGPKNTIRLSRSMGSGLWLYPEGPLRTAAPYALAYRRDMGTIRIEVVSTTFDVNVRNAPTHAARMRSLLHTLSAAAAAAGCVRIYSAMRASRYR